MDSLTQTLTFLIIMFGLVTVSLASAIVIRRRSAARREGIVAANIFPFRRIAAFEVLQRVVGRAIEADRPVLISTGASSLGDEGTLVTLAALSLAYYTTEQMNIGQTAPILLTSRSEVVPLAYDMLERAYTANGVAARTRFTSVRWYGTVEEKSLVFAAMMTVTMQSEKTAGAVMVGRFGRELGLALGAAQRRGLETVAGSDDIVGQAVAYVMSDAPLIGEEVFAPVGYLGAKASERGSIIAQDLLRGFLIVMILVVAVIETTGGGFLAPLFNILGG